MAIDVSTIKDVVANAPPAEAVKEVTKAPPAKTDTYESKESVIPKEPKEARAKAPPTTEEVVKAAAEIEVHLRTLDTDLHFEVDVEDNEVVVKVLDPETEEVIRQIPSEEVVAIREKIDKLQKQVGVLHDIRT